MKSNSLNQKFKKICKKMYNLMIYQYLTRMKYKLINLKIISIFLKNLKMKRNKNKFYKTNLNWIIWIKKKLLIQKLIFNYKSKNNLINLKIK